MAITRIRNSTISNRTPKYNDVLAGLPFRPIIGTASDGGNGTSASVAFTGNNSGGAGVTYTALSSPGSFTGTGTASPITVSGLTAGTAYTFQVKAGNSLGDSAYSAASNSVTPVTPTAFESIATVTATGGETSLSFTSIPSTYRHLQIRGIVKSNFSSTSFGDYYVTFNNVTGTSYAYHYVAGNGTAASASGVASTGSITAYGIVPFGTGSDFGGSIIDIHDYASTTKNKTVRIFGGEDRNSTQGNIVLTSGLFNSTSAITSVKIEHYDGYKAGTTFALYGVKGA